MTRRCSGSATMPVTSPEPIEIMTGNVAVIEVAGLPLSP
ncbi:hypothetical protein J2W42_003447 [Rhizobium tibeticum]|uniref:Uncharacterized protein n=1 Tax=Rhizobium tibeticum TaxID=501024 RepID=A0A1H8F1H2_9HYPH|nr:hypothetical protein [Rhizobium tibeticum]SEH39531.1 hypothetical protein RTCCBAU85039_0131 [Rhizobium tibeticum]SEN25234.1 hypothetical protein SAMN05216228_1003133 [Rhizobium tibeticum]